MPLLPGKNAGPDGRRTGSVATARTLGTGDTLGFRVPRFSFGAEAESRRALAAWGFCPGLPMAFGTALMADLGGASDGGFIAGVGASLAAGAGVGAEVFGAEDWLIIPPAIAIFSTSSKNAAIVCSFMGEVYIDPN